MRMAKIQRLLKTYIVKSQTNMPKEQYDKMSLKIKVIYGVSRLQTSPKIMLCVLLPVPNGNLPTHKEKEKIRI